MDHVIKSMTKLVGQIINKNYPADPFNPCKSSKSCMGLIWQPRLLTTRIFMQKLRRNTTRRSLFYKID